MDKSKTRDITFRAFAVLISLILWMYVASDQNPEIQTDIASIPVKLVNAEALSQAGLVMIEKPADYTIRLNVKGRSKDILSLKPINFKAEANLGNGYRVKGINSILVELKDYPRNIEIPNQPIYISVELDEYVQKNFPVIPRVEGSTKDGYTTLAATVKPAEVILKGPAKYMSRVSTVAAKVDIKNLNSDLQTSLPVQVLDKDEKSVPEIECIPKTVDVTVPIKKAVEVPINIKTTGNLPAGVFLMGTSVTPSKVRITGDERVLSAVKFIETVPIGLEGVNETNTRVVRLNLPPGVILLDNIQTVNVDISVEKTINKTFSVLVNYSNLPGELTADLLTNNISVTLSGQESAINKIIAADISALVDLGKAPKEDGEYEFSLNVTVPQGLKLVSMNPSRIKVKITKKQG